MGSLTYFISDLHLGARSTADRLAGERRVVSFLKSIKPTAKRLYLLGDVLDYWFEYRTVVPRGYVRFFGALAELADAGVEITWFIGNHDIWIFDYLPSEIGLRVVDGSEVADIDGRRFFLAHGDGLGKLKPGFRLIRSVFRNRVCQRLFAAVHPRWTVPLAMKWSASSRRAGGDGPAVSMGDNEPYVAATRLILDADPSIDFFILGHRHVLMDREIADGARLIILGDWIYHFSYAVWDGERLSLQKYTE
jgi:UDP-2,3-diacylglucosamine hydrolase